VIEAGGHAASGQVVPDRVLPAGQGEQAAGADRTVDLDRRTAANGCGRDGWRTCRAAAAGQQLLQLGQRESRGRGC
jgi:hypothetical protein